MGTKVLNNKAIMDAKDNVMKAINAELNNGIPVSVMSMIIQICNDNINNILAEIISAETSNDKEKKG